MGAGAFDGRVRDGIGSWAHRSGHQAGAAQDFVTVGVRQAVSDSLLAVGGLGS